MKQVRPRTPARAQPHGSIRPAPTGVIPTGAITGRFASRAFGWHSVNGAAYVRAWIGPASPPAPTDVIDACPGAQAIRAVGPPLRWTQRSTLPRFCTKMARVARDYGERTGGVVVTVPADRLRARSKVAKPSACDAAARWSESAKSKPCLYRSSACTMRA